MLSPYSQRHTQNEPSHKKFCLLYAKTVQISSKVTVQLRKAFCYWYIDKTFALFLKSKISSLKHLLWFYNTVVSDLVENPEDRFIDEDAQIGNSQMKQLWWRSKLFTNVDENIHCQVTKLYTKILTICEFVIWHHKIRLYVPWNRQGFPEGIKVVTLLKNNEIIDVRFTANIDLWRFINK